MPQRRIVTGVRDDGNRGERGHRLRRTPWLPFLLTLEASGVPPESAARPEVAVGAAAIDWSEISPWWPHHPKVVTTSLGHEPRFLPFVRAILAQPAAA